MVIYSQLKYIRSREIGYNRNQVLVINNTDALDKQIKTFRQEMTKISGVQTASVAGSMPTDISYNQNGWFRDPLLDAKQVTIMTDFYADHHYIPTMDMHMAAGRNFSPDFPTDSSAVIINETAAKFLGYKNPLNQKLYRPNGYVSNGGFASKEFHIIGVMKDFNFSSMHDKVVL